MAEAASITAMSVGHVARMKSAIVEYRLVVIPCPSVHGKWLDESVYVRNTYSGKDFRIARPEILLGKFKAKEELEDLLLKWLQNVTAQTTSFNVLLNNYGSMPGHPLFVRVQDIRPFRPLMNGLKMISGMMEDNGCTGIFFPSPRLPVADYIEPSVELEILLEYSGRSFYSEMEVDEIQLIRNDFCDGTEKVISRMRLLPFGMGKLFQV